MELLSGNLIDEKIAIFYRPLQHLSIAETIDHCFSGCAYNFLEIKQLLHESNLNNCSYYDNVCNYIAILPVFAKSVQIFESTELQKLALQWIGPNLEFVLRSLSSPEKSATSVVENVLLLTSVLEYALGNVYLILSENRIPPHLLRDLLSSHELIEFFGIDAIIFLKILLGIPSSINLRNIVWHGFPGPYDIPNYYVAVLVLAMHSLGEILKQKCVKQSSRPQVEDYEYFLTKFENFPPYQIDANEIEAIVASCERLNSRYKVYWQRILWLFEKKEYWLLVVLILPQIELILRLIYGNANNYDVSAKLDEYYITMDTIFEFNVPLQNGETDEKKVNKLLELDDSSSSNSSSIVITEGTLKCLYDLFISPHGPRLRDKVSHGEVNMRAINNALLCRILMHVSLNLLTGDEERFPLSGYESKYHLNALTRQSLYSAMTCLQAFTSHCLNDAIDAIKDCNENKRIRIFQRPKREAELMHLIFRISNLVTKACENYEEAIAERRQLLQQRKLHSKRRKTLANLLIALQTICLSFRDILDSMMQLYVQSQGASDEFWRDPAIEKLLRFLKVTLEISENNAKYADKASNEWIRSLQLCDKFTKIKHQYLG